MSSFLLNNSKRGHNIDKKDFEVLKILDKNSRVSYSKIAEATKLSLRNISSRIDTLIENGIITRFTAQFNYNSLGYRHYIGSIQAPNGQKSINFFGKLQMIPEIYRIWEFLSGSLIISFFCENAKHLEELINNLMLTGATVNSYNETRTHFPFNIPYSITDWQMIFFLLNNSRASKKSIAEDLGISEKTVKRRLNRLKNMNLISFIPEVNFEKITGMITAVVSLQTTGPSKEIYLKIKEDPSITYWRNAGSVFPSIVLFLYGKNLTEIYEMYLSLRDRNDIKKASLNFIVRNAENSTLIEDAIIEKLS